VNSSECGFAVRWQHIFRTANGVRKPNILAVKGGRGHILDIQIILGARALSEGHTTKRDYYASNLDLLARVGDLLQVPSRSLDVSTMGVAKPMLWGGAKKYFYIFGDYYLFFKLFILCFFILIMYFLYLKITNLLIFQKSKV